jgi:hypothetical protein
VACPPRNDRPARIDECRIRRCTGTLVATPAFRGHDGIARFPRSYPPDDKQGERDCGEYKYGPTKRMTAPKFGSAASGGLENEPAPERHGR